MQLEQPDFETILEAIELWEKGTDQLDSLTESLATMAVPGGLRKLFKEEADLRRTKAKEDAARRKERGVLLRAKLIQIRDTPTPIERPAMIPIPDGFVAILHRPEDIKVTNVAEGQLMGDIFGAINRPSPAATTTEELNQDVCGQYRMKRADITERLIDANRANMSEMRERFDQEQELMDETAARIGPRSDSPIEVVQIDSIPDPSVPLSDEETAKRVELIQNEGFELAHDDDREQLDDHHADDQSVS